MYGVSINSNFLGNAEFLGTGQTDTSDTFKSHLVHTNIIWLFLVLARTLGLGRA